VTGNTGDVLNWLSTTDGVHYTNIANTTTAYDANNLTTTTSFVAVIQNGESCLIDTAAAAKVMVDPQTVGGSLSPSSFLFCLNQDKDALLKLTGQVGTSVNWQSSPDGSTWTDLAPPNPDSVYEIPPGLTTSTYYRVRVQSGVCPEQPSAPAVVNIVNTPFPQATTEPADTLICYNSNATLNATITIGTSYSWNNTNTLSGQGDGTITSLPTFLSATASPKSTTNYVLNVENAGCPNPLKDTFHVRVYQPIIVDAGNDTSVVVNEPLQLHVSSNDTSAAGDTFTWTPSLGLDNPNIADPIGIYSAETDSIRYFVTATSIAYGCTGLGEVLVKIFKTGPDIFVPNAFTPGNATNRVFRPIPVGITALQYFRIYNRWGQLVYSTSRIGDGWDGMQNGRPLPPGSYVWMVQGTTYTNHTVFHKGVMVLVR
jgi:gliding motility-associated-like protein